MGDYVLAAVKHICLPLAFAGLVVLVLSFIEISLAQYVKSEGFYQAAITFTTGALISVFLAVFGSSAKRIQRLRNLPGATTIYFVAILDLILIVFAGLGIDHDISQIANAALLVTTTLMIDTIYMIMRLVYISFKE